jgi:hypothetical protein
LITALLEMKTQVPPESGEKQGEGGARKQPALSLAEKAEACRERNTIIHTICVAIVPTFLLY